MQATVITCSNPFAPALGRTVRTVRNRRRTVRELAPQTAKPFICLHNGQALLRAQWSGTTLADGDVLAFVTLPQGGGNGGKILRTVAIIALTIYAPGAGAALAGPGASAGAVQLWTAGVMLAGSALINRLIPPPSALPQQTASQSAASSPTYSLQAQGNFARIGSAIPVQYGRHPGYPDFAAEPYGEFLGNEQWLYQLFCVGQGHHDVEEIRIGEALLSNYAQADYQIVQPGGAVTLFPVNVVTSADVAGVTMPSEIYVGPYIATAAGITANQIALDMVCPRGLYYTQDDGNLTSMSVAFAVEVREIDNDGNPVGLWTQVGSESITGVGTTPIRQTFQYRFDDAKRMEVRVIRTDIEDESTRAGHEIAWYSLRAYVPGQQEYGNVTLLAVRLRATSELSQAASRKVSVLATRMLPIWNGSFWSDPLPTRSIAWALADACRNTDYGARLADNRIDLATLLELDAVWAARGDYFDGRFDTASTFWESLNQIARAGRAKAFQQGGIVRVVRDQAQALPVGMFTPRNTVRGSLNVDYLMPTVETADCVVVSYFDQDTWSEQEVTATLPGSTSETPARVQLFGVTSRNQAWREGMYMAACNRYRRKSINLTTEMEGFIPSFGDLVAVASERLTAAQYGELTAWNAGTKTASLSEPVAFGTGAHYIALRRANGSMGGPYQVSPGANAREVVLVDAPDFVPYTGGARERTHFSFGTATTYRQLALVVTARPRGQRVELGMVSEYLDGNGVAYVHEADTGTPPAPLQPWQLPRLITAPSTPLGLTLVDELVQIGNSVRTQLNISWLPVFNAELYRISYRVRDGNWIRLPDQNATTASVLDIAEDLVYVRVTAVNGVSESAAAQASLVVYGRTARPADVAGFSVVASAGFALAEWALHPDLDVRVGGKIVVRHTPKMVDAEWVDGIVLNTFPGISVTGQLPLMEGTYMAKAQDSSGQWSLTFASFVTPEGMVDDFIVVDSTDQSPAFPGVKTNLIEVGGVLRLDSALTISEMLIPVSQWPKLGSLGGVSGAGQYEFDEVMDFGTKAVRRLEADIEAFSYDTGDKISMRGLVSTWSSVIGNDVDDCDATLFISTTDDNPAGSPVWGPWTPFFVGDFNCRAAKYMLTLASGQPTHNIDISTLRLDAKVLA